MEQENKDSDKAGAAQIAAGHALERCRGRPKREILKRAVSSRGKF